MEVGAELAERFVLEARAGRGAMGVVFRARDLTTGTAAAVKTVPLGVPGVGGRFAREIHALRQLDDPHVVRYLAHGVAQDEAWLAMEWLEGHDLQSRLATGRLSRDEALELARRVARALGEAHARGVVHRDLKPSNLFLPGGDVSRVKILDFGVVQLADKARLTKTGTVLGTPAYMAPEQASARPVDARADVYGLAGVLFASLTGRPPFVGKSALALLARTVFETPPRVDALVPELSAPLADLVEAALAKDPASRPADGHAFAASLEALDLGAAPSAPAPTGYVSTAEIRLVSVVVVQRPPGEDVDGQRAAVEAVGAPLGGRVARLVDGSWVLLVLGRESATDFSVSSARAALALRRLFWGAPIALATGRARLDGPEPHGQAVEQAVALLARARGDAVVTDTLTAELAQDAFRFERTSDRGARLLVEARTQTAPVLGRWTRLVGRRGEVARVAGRWADAQDESRAQALLFTGVPGLGKSRLLRAAVDDLRAEATTVLHAGQGVLHRGEALSLAGALLASAAGLEAREPLTVRRRRLASYLEGRMAAEDAGEVAEALGPAAGVPPRRRRDDDPRLAAEQARQAATRWIAAERRRGPMLCAIDDAQWADRASLEVIDEALKLDDGPALLLLAGRPAAGSVVAAAWAGRALEHVALAPLGDRSAARLVRQIAGDDADDDAVSAAVRVGAGNPYYLEELARAVAGSADEVPLPTGSTAGSLTSVPATVQAMADARLGGLAPELRRVLRAASVLGARFEPEALAALLGDTDGPRLYAALEQLVSAELLDAEGRGGAYRFRHDLLRDAAYAQLTDGDRRAGHRRAAEWAAARDRPEAAVVAEHMRMAGLARAAGRWFSRAAETAFAAGDVGAARHHAEAGLGCDPEPELRGDLLRVDAEARLWGGQVAEAAAQAAAGRAAAPRGSRAWHRAVAVHLQAAGRAGALDVVRDSITEVRAVAPTDAARVAHRLALAHGARELMRAGASAEAEAVLRTLDDRDLGPLARAEIESARGFAAMHRGDLEVWRHHLQEALHASETAGHISQVCALRGELGFVSAQLGDIEVAWAQVTAAHKEAARLRLTHVECWLLSLLPPLAMERDRPEAALELAERAVRALRPLGDPRLEGCARVYLARALVLAGDLARAGEEARRAAEQLTPFVPLSGFAWAVRAEVALAADDVDAALAHAEQAQSLRAQVGHLEEGDASVGLALSRALRAAGRAGEAREVARAAFSDIERAAERLRDPEMRQAFLTGPSVHRALGEAAEAESATSA